MKKFSPNSPRPYFGEIPMITSQEVRHLEFQVQKISTKPVDKGFERADAWV
jgi:hypothetical protein